MPIMPTIVGFRGGDAIVPTSVGYFAGIANFVAAAIGFLEAIITAELAVAGTIHVMAGLDSDSSAHARARTEFDLEIDE
jgi:hypothetical protein